MRHRVVAGTARAIHVFRARPWRICDPGRLLSTHPLGSIVERPAQLLALSHEIVIGDRVLCGCNVTIVDADWHGLDPARRSDGVGATAPVRIENDAFLGMGVVVLKGVTIGRGSVVGAGSVVTRSIPPMSVAAGNPARVVGQL